MKCLTKLESNVLYKLNYAACDCVIYFFLHIYIIIFFRNFREGKIWKILEEYKIEFFCTNSMFWCKLCNSWYCCVRVIDISQPLLHQFWYVLGILQNYSLILKQNSLGTAICKNEISSIFIGKSVKIWCKSFQNKLHLFPISDAMHTRIAVWSVRNRH